MADPDFDTQRPCLRSKCSTKTKNLYNYFEKINPKKETSRNYPKDTKAKDSQNVAVAQINYVKDSPSKEQISTANLTKSAIFHQINKCEEVLGLPIQSSSCILPQQDSLIVSSQLDIMPAKSVTHTNPDMCSKPEESAQPKESLTHPIEISSAGTFCQNQNDGIEYSSQLTTTLSKKEAFELPKSDLKCQKCEKCLMDCSISTITDELDDLEVNGEVLDESTDKFSKEICYNAMSKSTKSEIVQPNAFISTTSLEKTVTSKRNCTFTNPHPIKIRQGVRLRSTKHKAENGLELDLHLRKSNLAYDKVNSSCNRSALRKRKSEFIINKMKSQKSILPSNLNYSTNRLTLVNLSRSDDRIFSISQTSHYATLKLQKSKGNEHISSTQTTSPKSMIPIAELVKMQTHAKKKKTGYNKYLSEETTSNQFICKDFQGDKPEIPTGFHPSKQNSPNFEDSLTVRWKRLSDFVDESLLNAIRPINHALCTDKKSNLDPADCQPKRGRISRSTGLNDDDVEPNIRNKETFDMSKEINSSVLLKSYIKPSHGNNNGELMPDFELMDSQTRNEELEKYGLKTFKKRREIEWLQHAYKRRLEYRKMQ